MRRAEGGEQRAEGGGRHINTRSVRSCLNWLAGPPVPVLGAQLKLRLAAFNPKLGALVARTLTAVPTTSACHPRYTHAALPAP